MSAENLPNQPDNSPANGDCRPASCLPERIEALKRAVSTVLMDALNGSNPDYRLPKEEGGFVRWGKVEAAIHATIETSLANVKPSQRDQRNRIK